MSTASIGEQVEFAVMHDHAEQVSAHRMKDGGVEIRVFVGTSGASVGQRITADEARQLGRWLEGHTDD